MCSSFKKFKLFSPYLLVIVYPLLVALDIFTTYIGTPDLVFEDNWLIRVFDLGWISIIVGAGLFVITIIGLLIWFNSRLNITFEQPLSSASRWGLALLMGVFFGHLIISLFVVINNFLAYFFLFGGEDCFLHPIAKMYVLYYQDIPDFHISINLILFVIGFSIGYFKYGKLKNKILRVKT